MGASLQALAAARDRLASLERELTAERERRNNLIVTLVDQGTPRRDVCQAGGVSPKSVCIFLSSAPLTG
jgi:hypothetical protein